jgi:intracellular proteinase inhibitor BsuPI
MMARVAMLVGIWLATAGYTSCSFRSGTDPRPDSPDYVDPFGSSLTLRDVNGVETRSFVVGEPVRFDFEIVNLTNQRQVVQFPDGQDHDFVVVDNGTSQIRWKWSQNMAFTQATTELTFEPNASKTYTLYWPGTLADGTQLPVGTYQARGALVFDGFRANPLAPNQMGSELETFTVR